MRSVQLLIIYFLVPFALCDKFDFIENSSKISEPLDQMYLKRKQGKIFEIESIFFVNTCQKSLAQKFTFFSLLISLVSTEQKI